MARLTSLNNTIQGAVYDKLKKSIITLKLLPGTVISTQEIADEMNVSRTPVREAFLQLQREDLVETVPQKLTIVSRINLNLVEQERLLRESLEVAAIPLFLKNCTPEIMAKLQDNLKMQRRMMLQKDAARFIEYDNAFHGIILSAAGQDLFWRVITLHSGHYNRIRTLTVRDEGISLAAFQQHEHMIQLMERGEEEALCQEVQCHVRKLHREKEDLIRQYSSYFAQNP